MKKDLTIKEMFKEKLSCEEVYSKVMDSLSEKERNNKLIKYAAVPALVAVVVCGGVALGALRHNR